MATTGEQVKEVIASQDGKASKQHIARALGVSFDYVRVVCGELEAKGQILYSDGWYSMVVKKKKTRVSKTKKLGLGVAKRATADNHRYEEPVKDSRGGMVALSALPGMTNELNKKLAVAGYTTIESLAETAVMKLIAATRLSLQEAAGVINKARAFMKKDVEDKKDEDNQGR